MLASLQVKFQHFSNSYVQFQLSFLLYTPYIYTLIPVQMHAEMYNQAHL